MSQTPHVEPGESPERSVGVVAAAPYHKPHYNHGHSPARWTGVVISSVGALVGGVAFPFHQWAVVYVGAALQIVALIAVVAMNAAGYGVPDVWGELKAEAKTRDGGLAALPGGPAPAAVAGPEAEAQVKELSAH